MKTKGQQPHREPIVSIRDLDTLHVACNGERVVLCSNQKAYHDVELVAAPGSIPPVVEHFAKLLAERYNLAPELLATLEELVFLTEGIAGLDVQQQQAMTAARAAIAKTKTLSAA